MQALGLEFPMVNTVLYPQIRAEMLLYSNKFVIL